MKKLVFLSFLLYLSGFNFEKTHSGMTLYKDKTYPVSKKFIDFSEFNPQNRSAAGLNNDPVWTYEGEASHNYFGACVSSAGDVNGDNYSDIIISTDG